MSAQQHDTLDQVVPDLVAYARRRGLQPADADDVAQEAVTRLLEGTPAARAHARPWSYRVASHLITDRFRGRSREQALAEQAGPLLVDAPDSADLVAFAQDVALAAQALAAIEPRYQQVVRLVDLDGMSTADAAAVLGVTPATMRQLRHRAHKSLRREYLRLGGTAAGFVLLFPALRAASRLRVIATTGAVPVAVVLSLGVLPSPLPYATPLGPERSGVQAAESLPDPEGWVAGGPGTLLGVARPVRVKNKRVVPMSPSTVSNKRSTIELHDCSTPEGKQDLICHDTGKTGDTATYIGVTFPEKVCLPSMGCSRGYYVSYDSDAVKPVCQPVPTNPLVYCDQGPWKP